MTRARHRFGTLLVVVGTILIAYAAATLFWRDPVTDVYNRWKQNQLTSDLEQAFEQYRASHRGSLAADGQRDAERAVAEAARDFQKRLKLGQPLGRIVVPRLGLDAVFIHGTRWGPDLSRGPGHYPETEIPGLRKTVGIAGHRTTFGAPFRKIDKLRRGDPIVLELAYGTFRYRVFTHEIVKSNDWSVIRDRGFDTVMLSACHPLYSSKQRWIVYARLVEVEPVGGRAYELPGGRALAAAAS
jgi:sortase A